MAERKHEGPRQVERDTKQPQPHEAKPVQEADDYGQQGDVRDAKHPDEKPSPDTVAQVQELSDDESSR